MILCVNSYGEEKDSVPRVGGGDPYSKIVCMVNLACSPRRRG